MKAYRLYGVNDIRYEEIEKPHIEPNTVLVKVEAAGICGSDIPRIYKTGAYHHPMTPGHEFAGIVVDVADDVSSEWKGRRVGVFPLIPCMECPQCKKAKYEMCQKYSYLGSRTDGGFAEYVRVPAWNLIVLPDNVSYEQAAMLEPTSVAMHAIRRVGVNTGDTVAICGLGTIGLLIAMILQGMGCCNLILIGNKDSQKQMLHKLGISDEQFCDVRSNSVKAYMENRTGGRGVDVFFECVGKNETVQMAIDETTAGGKVMLVGNPASDMLLEKNCYWKILRKQLEVLGTWNSSFTKDEKDDWNQVISAIDQGTIHPEYLITHKFELENLRKGLECMRDKTGDYVKIMTCVTKQ